MRKWGFWIEMGLAAWYVLNVLPTEEDKDGDVSMVL